MIHSLKIILSICLLTLIVGNNTKANDALNQLIENACIDCHDADSENGLDLSNLEFELDRKDSFTQWEKVFDRVNAGEMPPLSEERPEASVLQAALDHLRAKLQAQSKASQASLGRVQARRLTKRELGYTLMDLLHIDIDVTSGVPDEVESGSFDTVGANQRLSAIHMESYLQAASEALEGALQVGRNPYYKRAADFNFLDEWHEKPLNQGGSITRKLRFGDGVVLFRDIDYLTGFQYEVRKAGKHILRAAIAAYQTDKPLTAKFIVKTPAGNARIAKSIDLIPGAPQVVEVETFLRPGDQPYLTFQMEGDANAIFNGGAKHYRGPGLAILKQEVEGPIYKTWPPASATFLLADAGLTSQSGNSSGPFNLEPPKDSDEAKTLVAETLHRIATSVFRREIEDGELDSFIALAEPAIAEGRDLIEVLKVPLRSMLSSPQFLFFESTPGELGGYALANRLSYFLWKSLPDEELMKLASTGQLKEPAVLSAQVERMLRDEKSNRFVRDFLGQWLLLYKLNATTPDDGLYPEFDELLAAALPQETELFFRSLLDENLSLDNLIDSEFTFLNRRLAEHYGIASVTGQEFQKVIIPGGSPRGGILTQASVLKTTANGTTTSPVTRGNFVLTNLLGTPPSPPPPSIGSIEPDTRGKTTIREILASHRDLVTCNQCHREIDPPGFAMESFDPIGRYREHYRVSGGETSFGGFQVKNPPRNGRRVDPSGVTSDGRSFEGIQGFKKLLMNQREQVFRHFISQLIVYSTGAEIQFSDRDEVKELLEAAITNDLGMRDILHSVIQSKVFRNQ